MTLQTQSGKDNVNQLCSAKEVEDYLIAHPEFFLEYSSLLVQIEVPHVSGAAVSLIERQVVILRDDNKQLRRRIKELVDIARDNEYLVNKLHSLNMQLIDAQTLNSFLNVITEQITSNFDAHIVSIRLFRDAPENAEDKHIFVSRNNTQLSNFDKFLKHKKSVCGRFNSQQLAFLFGDRALEVKSMALIPIVDGESVGMLAIASNDPDHFKAGMSTSLLASLSDVASSVYKRFK